MTVTQTPPLRRRTSLIIATAATTAVLLTGCGNADPAEVNELADILHSDHSPLGMPIPTKQATCLAQIYLESGLSDKAITNLKNGKPLAPATKDDHEAITEIAGKALDCN